MIKDNEKTLIIKQYKEYTGLNIQDNDLLINKIDFIGSDKKLFKNSFLIEILNNKSTKTLTIYENGNIFNLDTDEKLIKDELYVIKLKEECINGKLTKTNYLKNNDFIKVLNKFSGNQFFKHFLNSFLIMDKSFDYKLNLVYFNNHLKCTLEIDINNFQFTFYFNHSGFFSFYSTINTPTELIESYKFIINDSYYFKHKNGHTTEVNITKFEVPTIARLLLKEAGIELDLDINNFAKQFKLINIMNY